MSTFSSTAWHRTIRTVAVIKGWRSSQFFYTSNPKRWKERVKTILWLSSKNWPLTKTRNWWSNWTRNRETVTCPLPLAIISLTIPYTFDNEKERIFILHGIDMYRIVLFAKRELRLFRWFKWRLRGGR